MPVVNVYNTSREQVDTLDLSDDVFGTEVKEHLFHLMVRYQLAARRAGTHATKARSWVAGGGRKPWRQKGTGRARQGSTRAPHWRGGGVVFGPHPRSHAFDVPKKVRRAALRGALSRRVGENALVVLDSLQFEEAKTRLFASFMKRFEFTKVLVVVPEVDASLDRASRNLPGVTVLPVVGLNVYDVLRHQNLVMTVGAVEGVIERLKESSNG